MFGIAWSELLLIGIVALVVVPPKDLPTMMRTVGKWIGQMRRMAFDFQHQVSSALREAEFDDIKKSVADMTSFDAMGDIRAELESATQPLTKLEGQMREDLTLAAPGADAFKIEAPRPEAVLTPEADSATPPGHSGFPGAMDAAIEAPQGVAAWPHTTAVEPVPEPIPVTVTRLPAQAGGSDSGAAEVEPIAARATGSAS